jgi:hypothetical protein
MTAKLLPTPKKRSRLIQPPSKAIPPEGKVAVLSTEPDNADPWSYQGKPGETPAEALGALSLQPGMTAAATIKQFAGYTNIELHGLVNALHTQVEAVNSGDMTRPEGMLVAQAHTLDSMFNTLANRAKANMAGDGQYLQTAEMYLRLAFKAQSQCRATLETLGQLKNPGNVAFVRQANIAHGPQQINNAEPHAGAGKNESQPNKLLEDQRGKWMDLGAQEAAGRLDQALAAMGKVHRPEIARGQSEGQSEWPPGQDTPAPSADGASIEGIEARTGRVLMLQRQSATRTVQVAK